MININQMFRAFADETRLRILHLLSKGELCVCDLMATLNQPQSKISRHLGYLKRAGLVIDRREGQWRHYSLAKPTSEFHQRLIKCVDGCLNDTPVFRQDAVRLKAGNKTQCK